MKQWLLTALLLAAAGAAFAAGPKAVRAQVESSLLVTGTIDIDGNGQVLDHALERESSLPAGVRQLVANAVAQWRFDPVALDPGDTYGRARMSLRIVAKKIDHDRYTIGIRSASFGSERADAVPSSKVLTPPRYPRDALERNVSGIVYLVVSIGRDGRITDVVAEQTNLRVIDSEAGMQRWRHSLEQAALHAARGWSFTLPTHGASASQAGWRVRVPVDFTVGEGKPPTEHEWSTYIPGPRRSIQGHSQAADTGADAVAAGRVELLGDGPRLLSALDAG